MKAALGLLALFVSSAGLADVVVPIEAVKNHVNIRLSADAKSEIVGKLRQGDSAPYLQSNGDWHEVEIAGGASGYISAEWSTIVEDDATVADAEQSKTEAEAVDRLAADTGEENAAALEEIDIDFAAMRRVAIVATVIESQAAESESEYVVDAAALQGPKGDTGPAGPPGAATIEGSVDFLMKFSAPTIGANSQIYDDGINVGINTVEPKQRLDVNGNIQIHDRNSNVAGLMISQADGDTGYVMHNRANTLTIGAGSVDRITIDREGNVGFSVDQPDHPIQMVSGAYVSAGGVWTNSSSRARKENIADLTPEDAAGALAELQPVEFNYKNDHQEKYLGFIAEDVPDLVATADRQSLSTMDIVAVLTKVVQEQQKKIAELEARLDRR